MAAQIGRSLPLSSTWQGGGVVLVGQTCLPQSVPIIEPETTASTPTETRAASLSRLLYLLMLLRVEQLTVVNLERLRGKSGPQIPDQCRRLPHRMPPEDIPQDHANFRGN